MKNVFGLKEICLLDKKQMAPTKSFPAKIKIGFPRKDEKLPIKGKLVSTQTKIGFYSKKIWRLLTKEDLLSMKRKLT